MIKVIKNPEVFEAIQFSGDDSVKEMKSAWPDFGGIYKNGSYRYLVVGRKVATFGDFVIRSDKFRVMGRKEFKEKFKIYHD